MKLSFEIDGEPAVDPGETPQPRVRYVPGRVVHTTGPTREEIEATRRELAAAGLQMIYEP